MSAELHDLEKRIRRLESQNRRLKWTAVGLLALGLATAAWGQNAKDAVIKAQKFELLDDTGRVRADLSIRNGASALRFIDSDGVNQSVLSGDQFNMYDKQENILATFAKWGIEIGDGHQKTYVRITGREEDRMGELQVNDYRTRTYVVLTAKELAKLRQLDVNSPKRSE
jgi:hypothetical protein